MTNQSDKSNSNENAINDLLKFDPNTIEHDKAIELLEHLRNQFRNRYRYLVGEWSNARRAKDTRTGEFVKKQDVIDYLG